MRFFRPLSEKKKKTWLPLTLIIQRIHFSKRKERERAWKGRYNLPFELPNGSQFLVDREANRDAGTNTLLVTGTVDETQRNRRNVFHRSREEK